MSNFYTKELIPIDTASASVNGGFEHGTQVSVSCTSHGDYTYLRVDSDEWIGDKGTAECQTTGGVKWTIGSTTITTSLHCERERDRSAFETVEIHVLYSVHTVTSAVRIYLHRQALAAPSKGSTRSKQAYSQRLAIQILNSPTDIHLSPLPQFLAQRWTVLYTSSSTAALTLGCRPRKPMQHATLNNGCMSRKKSRLLLVQVSVLLRTRQRS